ncbi:TPA: glycosyltransferase family 8 protein [Enterobacter cloacae]
MMNPTTLNLNESLLNLQILDFNLDTEIHYSAVVYGVDGNFLMHCGISLLSIVQNTPEKTLHFFIITDQKNEVEFARLQSVIENTQHALTIIIISAETLTILPKTSVFPVAIYFRLLAPYLIKNYRYLLYIDADIVALNSISDLIEDYKPRDHICCAVKEPEQQLLLSKSINISDGDYFNSGMLYIDALNWNENNISQKVIECLLERRTEFKYFDQDALNVVLHKRVMFVDEKYNRQIKTGHKSADFMCEPPQETIFLHYVGSDKPWQLWNQQNISAHYRKYKKLSPWRDVADVEPRCAKELKKYYKMLLIKKQFVEAFYIFIKYHFVRLLEKKAKKSC